MIDTINELRTIIKKQEQEIGNLKKIIAKEFNENDELGAEYVLTSILKSENEKLRDALMTVSQCENCGGCREKAREALK